MDLANDLYDFILKSNCPGNMIFARIGGSHCYNLALPTSDVDFSGVYFNRTKDVVGIDNIKETWEQTKGYKPDYAFHEIGHLCRLILKGNPNIIESLFVNRYFWQDNSNGYWNSLRFNREKMLSRQVIKSYLGYMNGQLERLRRGEGGRGFHTAGGKQTEKWAYHILRLGMDCLAIAKGEDIQVFKEGEQHDFLMNIRKNETSYEDIEKLVSESITKVEALRSWNNLPEFGDRKFLEDWLLKIRKENW